MKDMGVNSNNKVLSKDSSFGFKTVIYRTVRFSGGIVYGNCLSEKKLVTV